MQRYIAEREYRASRNERGLQAPNRAHNLRTWFEPDGIRVHDRTAAGRSRRRGPTSPRVPRARCSRTRSPASRRTCTAGARACCTRRPRARRGESRARAVAAPPSPVGRGRRARAAGAGPAHRAWRGAARARRAAAAQQAPPGPAGDTDLGSSPVLHSERIGRRAVELVTAMNKAGRIRPDAPSGFPGGQHRGGCRGHRGPTPEARCHGKEWAAGPNRRSRPHDATAKSRHSPGTPFSVWLPRSSKPIPEPATRSRTVADTRIS